MKLDGEPSALQCKAAPTMPARQRLGIGSPTATSAARVRRPAGSTSSSGTAVIATAVRSSSLADRPG